ncbi:MULTISPECIES: MerR family transcriptional regulator [Desertihabitans]|nr:MULTISPECIES: MerR family transcriptional regulator [Desertihabitans]
MHIGELAERTGLSLRTIRHYDEVDLLKPSGRTDGGFRLYTEDDLDRLLLIRRMKPLGYSLEEMAALLRVIDALSDGRAGTEERARLSDLVAETERRRDRLAQQVAWAEEFLALLRSHVPGD